MFQKSLRGPRLRDCAKPVSVAFADRYYAARDRLLESPSFQRFSASFPLTRRVAHKNARALFDICAGFVYSQVLAACVQLDLFKRLAAGPKTLKDLAGELDLPEFAVERLLLAACSLKLIMRRQHYRYGLGVLGAAFNGNPGIAAMVEHHAMLYRDLVDPIALLRGGRGETELAQFWSYAGAEQPSSLNADRVERYSKLMTKSQSLIANDVLDSYSFGRHRLLLDVGGGEGSFIVAAAKRFRNLRFILFDLPPVTERARNRWRACGLLDRATAVGGSFPSHPLPYGADLVTLVRVIHDHDDGNALHILRAVYKALPVNGMVLIAEPMAGAVNNEPVGDAYFGMYLWAVGQGRPRTPAQITGLLQRAGFLRVKARKTRRPMLVSVITAQRLDSV